jgi:hypothetical protein
LLPVCGRCLRESHWDQALARDPRVGQKVEGCLSEERIKLDAAQTSRPARPGGKKRKGVSTKGKIYKRLKV